MEEDDFLPDIDDYLSESYDIKHVSSHHLDDMILTICSRVGVDENIVRTVVEYFFNEIRNKMLAGYMVKFANFGRFFISSPKTTKSRKKIEIKFKPSKQFIKKINDKKS